MVESPFVTDAVPAATIVLLRPQTTEGGIETLMLRRNTELAFAGGAWVFPGGRIEEADFDPLRPDDVLAAARNAAARETLEEAGLTLDPGEFVPLSRWWPPPAAPRRFDTWFFIARAPAGEVAIDGGEIHEHVWITPQAAMERRRTGEAAMIPPTWVTLFSLSRFNAIDEALRVVGAAAPDHFATRMVEHADGRKALLWDGDAGHLTGELDATGARHRLYLDEPDWRYERTAPQARPAGQPGPG